MPANQGMNQKGDSCAVVDYASATVISDSHSGTGDLFPAPWPPGVGKDAEKLWLFESCFCFWIWTSQEPTRSVPQHQHTSQHLCLLFICHGMHYCHRPVSRGTHHAQHLAAPSSRCLRDQHYCTFCHPKLKPESFDLLNETPNQRSRALGFFCRHAASKARSYLCHPPIYATRWHEVGFCT